MFPNEFRKPKEKKKESDGCEIDIRKTKTGKKFRFRGKCSREQIDFSKSEHNTDVED